MNICNYKFEVVHDIYEMSNSSKNVLYINKEQISKTWMLPNVIILKNYNSNQLLTP